MCRECVFLCNTVQMLLRGFLVKKAHVSGHGVYGCAYAAFKWGRVYLIHESVAITLAHFIVDGCNFSNFHTCPC